jgi:uncharacterized protein YbaR (Trm112 family)
LAPAPTALACEPARNLRGTLSAAPAMALWHDRALAPNLGLGPPPAGPSTWPQPENESPVMLNKTLLDILVCPVTKGPLHYDRDQAELISVAGRLAYPIRNDIPILLEDEARALSDDEVAHWRQR